MKMKLALALALIAFVFVHHHDRKIIEKNNKIIAQNHEKRMQLVGYSSAYGCYTGVEIACSGIKKEKAMYACFDLGIKYCPKFAAQNEKALRDAAKIFPNNE